MSTPKKLVIVNALDNVCICCQPVEANEHLNIEEVFFIAPSNIDVGHKLARKNIKAGEKIIRYGAPIGSATADIKIGEHVHIHNMKSDYIPSHTRQSKVGE